MASVREQLALRAVQLLQATGGGAGCQCSASEFGCTGDARVEQLSGALIRFCCRGASERQELVASESLKHILKALGSHYDQAAAAALLVVAALVRTADGFLAVQKEAADEPIASIIQGLAADTSRPVVQEAALQVMVASLEQDSASDWLLSGGAVEPIAFRCLRSPSHPVSSSAVPLLAGLVLRRAQSQDCNGSSSLPDCHGSSVAETHSIENEPSSKRKACLSVDSVLQHTAGDTYLVGKLVHLACSSSEHQMRYMDVFCELVPCDDGRQFLKQHFLGSRVLLFLDADDSMVRSRAVDAVVSASRYPGGLQLFAPSSFPDLSPPPPPNTEDKGSVISANVLEYFKMGRASSDLVHGERSTNRGGETGLQALEVATIKLMISKKRDKVINAIQLIGDLTMGDVDHIAIEAWLHHLGMVQVLVLQALDVSPTKEMSLRVPTCVEKAWAPMCYEMLIKAWHTMSCTLSNTSQSIQASCNWKRLIVQAMELKADDREVQADICTLRSRVLGCINNHGPCLPPVDLQSAVVVFHTVLLNVRSELHHLEDMSRETLQPSIAAALHALQRMLKQWPLLHSRVLFEPVDVPTSVSAGLPNNPTAVELLLSVIRGGSRIVSSNLPGESYWPKYEANGLDWTVGDEVQETACEIASTLLGDQSSEAIIQWAITSGVHTLLWEGIISALIEHDSQCSDNCLVSEAVSSALIGLAQGAARWPVVWAALKQTAASGTSGPEVGVLHMVVVLGAMLAPHAALHVRQAALSCIASWLTTPHTAADLKTGIVESFLPTTAQLSLSDSSICSTRASFGKLRTAVRACLFDEDPEVCAQALREVLPSFVHSSQSSSLAECKQGKGFAVLMAIDGDVALMQAAQLTEGLVFRAAKQVVQEIQRQTEARQSECISSSNRDRCQANDNGCSDGSMCSMSTQMSQREHDFRKWLALHQEPGVPGDTFELADLDKEATAFGQATLDCY